MTAETLAVLGSLAERYGLPLVLLAGFLWLILTERLVTGSRMRAMSALFEREREDRLKAEAIATRTAIASGALAKSVEGFATAVLEHHAPDAYVERLEGR